MMEQKNLPVESQVMRYCAVIVLKNINPRHLKAMELKLGEHDHYHFIAKKDSRWLIYQNVGRDLTEPENEALKRYVRSWGGGEKVECINGILQMEVPRFVWNFFEEVNKIPGARISPNTFQNNGDAYIVVEFEEHNMEKVSDLIMGFLADEDDFKKEIVYIGKQDDYLPRILGLFRDFGNSLEGFSVLETLWKPTVEERETQNMGIFSNNGTFIPKYFINGERDRLIARLDSSDVKGTAEYLVIDEKNRIVEFDVKSRFFSDFYEEVVERYSGPLFFSMKVNESGIFSYYVVERKVQQLFIQGLYRHWKRPSRVVHHNYVLGAHDLNSWIKYNEIPF